MAKLKSWFESDVLTLAPWNQTDAYIVAKQSQNFGNP